MKWRTVIFLVFLVVAFAGVAWAAEEELAHQLERGYETISTNANQTKFLSILFFVIFGGGSTYAVLRGIKKIVHVD